jgi:GT2 family glycosyltransferase
MSQPLPFVSLITVNYNGAHYLEICLPALRAQDYPSDRFEIIVVDNASSDSSLELLRTRFPEVKVIQNKDNQGFAEGNNIALRQARGDYLVLVNNDTAPALNWLSQLVKAAEEHPEAGMVSGHLQLFYDELELEFDVAATQVPGDGRSLGIQVYGVESGTPRGVVQYHSGFYGWETNLSGQAFRWSGARAVLGVPMPNQEGEATLSLSLAASLGDNRPVAVMVRQGESTLAAFYVQGVEPATYQVPIPDEIRRRAVPNEQNTGSIIFTNGMGRDRGTYVKETEGFFEREVGMYARLEEVFAGCGASLLMRKRALDEVGLLDGRFFMYYEDTDLCWRMRLRGWSVLYAPEARIRHIHSGTTKLWSPFFLFLIERNRLEMIFKNGPWGQIWRTWGGFALKVLSNGLETLIQLLRRRSTWRIAAGESKRDLRVAGSLLLHSPFLIWERLRIQTTKKVSHAALKHWFVEP